MPAFRDGTPTSSVPPTLFSVFVACAAFALLASGCVYKTGNDVVVYAALDKEFSQPVLNEFEKQSGTHVLAQFDVESSKTVGLFNRLLQERARPQCDVFWNNEILHTIRLARAGALESYRPANADDWPPGFRGSNDQWIGFAARARILIVNTDLLSDDERPKSILDLADPKWKGKAGIARPLFGTTATHSAVLFATWGNKRAEDFFLRLKQNAVVVSGNKDVAIAVANGQLAFGLTDTDDAMVEIDRGQPVTIVFPDQGEGAMGTLFIPNTLSITRNAPHPDTARKLVDYLLSEEVERRLADGPSAQFPVNPKLKTHVRIKHADHVRWMDVDFEAAADAWDHSAKFLDNLFGSGS
jgi:iron(III) transport system substrate-binding protein